MSTIKSKLTEAVHLSACIQRTATAASVMQSVAAAGNVAVGVNRDCLGAFGCSTSILAQYKAVADRDASYIESFASVLRDVDEDIARKIQS